MFVSLSLSVLTPETLRLSVPAQVDHSQLQCNNRGGLAGLLGGGRLRPERLFFLVKALTGRRGGVPGFPLPFYS